MTEQNKTPVMILVGGLGTRLKEVVPDLPKPMAPVLGAPFLEYHLNFFKKQGFNKFIFLTGYKSELIEDYFGDGSQYQVQIQYSREDRPMGTAGAIRLACERFGFESCLVANGDSLVFADLRDLIYLKHSSSLCKIGILFQSDTSRYGTVSVDKNGKVNAFYEKVPGKEGFINSGVYYFSSQALKLISLQARSLETDVFPNWVNEGSIESELLCGNFIDIGLPSSLQDAQTIVPNWLTNDPKPCLFLDRDGVLIEHKSYLSQPEDVRLIPETVNLIKQAKSKGWHVIMITNQSGVGRGFFTIDDCNKVHLHIDNELKLFNTSVDGWYTSYTHPTHGLGKWKTESLDRKPNPGMILKACQNFNIDLKRSIFIGDNTTDQIKIKDLNIWLLKNPQWTDAVEARTRVFSSFADMNRRFLELK